MRLFYKGVANRKKIIPTILTKQELLDKAFGRSVKISKKGEGGLDSKRRTAMARISAAGDILHGTLIKYVKAFPSMERREDFHMELIDILVGLDALKKSLSALSWAADRCRYLSREYARRAKSCSTVEELQRVRKEYFGRTASVIDQISSDLEFVAKSREALKTIPALEMELPTVVVAGHPNVGKSQLVERISSAKPKIAPYPFTTQGISVGHFFHKYRKIQVIDTPGLLDREFETRNAIEKQAVLALKYLADVIVFLIDPSETSGYSLKEQLSLLESVKRAFPDITLIEVENKSDLVRSDSQRLKISALRNEGVDTLMKIIIDKLQDCSKWNQEDRLLPLR
ncbi:MAG: GTPase [Methanomassiliicoccales archaeon]